VWKDSQYFYGNNEIIRVLQDYIWTQYYPPLNENKMVVCADVTLAAQKLRLKYKDIYKDMETYTIIKNNTLFAIKAVLNGESVKKITIKLWREKMEGRNKRPHRVRTYCPSEE